MPVVKDCIHRQGTRQGVDICLLDGEGYYCKLELEPPGTICDEAEDEE